MLLPERSDKQKAAARENGPKSHGPVTPGGKSNAAAHAGRHNVIARTILLPGESRERFNQLYQSFVDDLLPVTPVELALVEKMAVSHWKQMRIWTLERAALGARNEPQNQPPADADSHNPDRHALALVNPAQSLAHLHSYESNCDRVFSRSLDRLLKMRAARQRAPDA